MNEPSENRLGCNALFTSHYSLIQQLSRNYRYSSMAACAAANRAIGTLNGEQLT